MTWAAPRAFGPVVPEPNEPVFHADWERRAFALTVAMARPGGWNIDMSRFARENRPPRGLSQQELFPDLARRPRNADGRARAGDARGDRGRQGAVRRQSPASRRSLQPRSTPAIRARRPDRARAEAARDVHGRRTVRMKDIHPATHTRLPHYVRGHLGTIELNHGCHVFPDTNALGRGRGSAMALHGAFRRARNCGARTPIRRSASPSTPGNPIWSAV